MCDVSSVYEEIYQFLFAPNTFFKLFKVINININEKIMVVNHCLLYATLISMIKKQ